MSKHVYPICAWCKQPSCQRHYASNDYFNAVMRSAPIEEREKLFLRECEVYELCEARRKPS